MGELPTWRTKMRTKKEDSWGKIFKKWYCFTSNYFYQFQRLICFLPCKRSPLHKAKKFHTYMCMRVKTKCKTNSKNQTKQKNKNKNKQTNNLYLILSLWMIRVIFYMYKIAKEKRYWTIKKMVLHTTFSNHAY